MRELNVDGCGTAASPGLIPQPAELTHGRSLAMGEAVQRLNGAYPIFQPNPNSPTVGLWHLVENILALHVAVAVGQQPEGLHLQTSRFGRDGQHGVLVLELSE